MATHYANAFTLTTTHCFRMVHHGDATGHPTHCPDLMTWRGRWQDTAGKWHTVVSCDGHRADLDAVQRVEGSVRRLELDVTGARYRRSHDGGT